MSSKSKETGKLTGLQTVTLSCLWALWIGCSFFVKITYNAQLLLSSSLLCNVTAEFPFSVISYPEQTRNKSQNNVWLEEISLMLQIHYHSNVWCQKDIKTFIQPRSIKLTVHYKIFYKNYCQPCNAQFLMCLNAYSRVLHFMYCICLFFFFWVLCAFEFWDVKHD